MSCQFQIYGQVFSKPRIYRVSFLTKTNSLSRERCIVLKNEPNKMFFYRDFLEIELPTLLEDLNHVRQNMWFQQDGATCHTARLTMDLLRGEFGEHFISQSGPTNWPPRSCNITPLDSFLWRYVKCQVFRNKPATIDALGANITRA